MFKIQVIATYNCDTSEIDDAILRKGRLIAKNTFKELSIEDSQKLLNKLEIPHTTNIGMTLADIYSFLDDDDDILLNDSEIIKEVKKPLI